MNTLKLQRWLTTVLARTGGDILLIQTLRNVIMSASVMASAALVALMGVLASQAYLNLSVVSSVAGLLCASAILSIAAIVQFSKLGFSLQFEASSHSTLASSLLLGFRLIQSSAAVLALALLVATLSKALL